MLVRISVVLWLSMHIQHSACCLVWYHCSAVSIIWMCVITFPCREVRDCSGTAEEAAFAIDAVLSCLHTIVVTHEVHEEKVRKDLEQRVKQTFASAVQEKKMSRKTSMRTGAAAAEALGCNMHLYAMALKPPSEPEKEALQKAMHTPLPFMPLSQAELDEERNARLQREQEQVEEAKKRHEAEEIEQEWKRQQEREEEKRKQEEEDTEEALGPESAAELAQQEARKAFEQERERLLQEYRQREQQLKERIAYIEQQQQQQQQQ